MKLEAFHKTNAHKHGCAVCTDTIHPSEDHFIWVGNHEGDAYCESCADINLD